MKVWLRWSGVRTWGVPEPPVRFPCRNLGLPQWHRRGDPVPGTADTQQGVWAPPCDPPEPLGVQDAPKGAYPVPAPSVLKKEHWSTPGVVAKKGAVRSLGCEVTCRWVRPKPGGTLRVTRPASQGEGRLHGLPALGSRKDTEESDPWVNRKLSCTGF